MANDPRQRWGMFSGMTRREQQVLIFLIVVIGAGLAWQEFKGAGRREPLVLHRAETTLSPTPAAPVPPASSDQTLRHRIAPSSPSLDGPLDINAATAAQLEILPGIGEVRAAAIIRYREAHGPFRSLKDLGQVPGIGDKTLEAIRPFLKPMTPVASPAPEYPPTPAPPEPDPSVPRPPQTVNINTAMIDELASLDGIGEVLAKRIIEHRRTRGPFRTPADIQKVKGIGASVYARNRHRIVVGK